MNVDPDNTQAQRLLQLFDAIRHGRPHAAFRRLSALNLSLSQFRLMRLLATNEALPMKELAERLHIRPPSVTALSARLAQMGLVQRLHHPGDNRVVLLSLTDAGRQLFTELESDRLRRMELLLQGLSPEEQQALIGLLDRAVASLQAEQPQAVGFDAAGSATSNHTE